MGNMDQYGINNRNSGRISSQDEDEEEDGEEHEQIRLVQTPDSLDHSSIMDVESHSKKSGESVQEIYSHLTGDMRQNQGKDFASIQCQNEFYFNYLSAKESKGTSKSNCSNLWKSKCKNASPLKWLISLVPILSWLPSYNWKSDLCYDAIAGFTVAVMNIPQGLAYALLANVDAICGLYMAFFPVITYSLLGTSRHVSIGTFAVICLMSGKVASEKAAYYKSLVQNNETLSSEMGSYSTTEIATSLSLCVGVWQLIMGMLQLGSLSVLLSSELISGFTTGCAVHVLTSQMKSLLGMKGDRRSGIFKIPLTYKDIALGIRKEGNLTAVVLSIVTISVLLLYNELLKARLSKKVPFPIPIELIAIIIGTLVSRYWITSDAFGFSIVSHIPTGLPNPTLPPIQIVPDIILDSLIIAVVAYAISISMVKIFARKHEYEISPNQELLANGVSNAFGSFFSCAPISVSLSRSLIQEQVGGKTQLAGIFSSVIILFVLLWIGPFFETLPHCVLSAMIIVALKGMVFQLCDFPKAWKESRLNGMIWMMSFVGTVFLDIEYGLVLGLIMTVASLLWNANRFSVIEVGQHFRTRLFVEMKLDNKFQVEDIPSVKILKLTGNLNFITADKFTTAVNSALVCSRRKSKNSTSDKTDLYSTRIKRSLISTLVLDFSSVSSVDPAALKSIRMLYDLQSEQGVQVLFAACPSNVLHTMDHCNFFDEVNSQHFYPSIDHAVQSLLACNCEQQAIASVDLSLSGHHF